MGIKAQSSSYSISNITTFSTRRNTHLRDIPHEMQLLTFLSFLFSFGATVIEAAAVISNGQSSITLTNALTANASSVNQINVGCSAQLPPEHRESFRDSCFSILLHMDRSTVDRTFGTGPEVDVHLPKMLIAGA